MACITGPLTPPSTANDLDAPEAVSTHCATPTHQRQEHVHNCILRLIPAYLTCRRWIFCCCQCCCNCCLPSSAPMKYIRDRGMKATKIFATLMALGVVASGIFGMTQAGKNLVEKTLYTVGLYTVCSITSMHSSRCQSRLGCDQSWQWRCFIHLASRPHRAMCIQKLEQNPPAPPLAAPQRGLPTSCPCSNLLSWALGSQ